jgi:hypothetical protein
MTKPPARGPPTARAYLNLPSGVEHLQPYQQNRQPLGRPALHLFGVSRGVQPPDRSSAEAPGPPTPGASASGVPAGVHGAVPGGHRDVTSLLSWAPRCGIAVGQAAGLGTPRAPQKPQAPAVRHSNVRSRKAASMPDCAVREATGSGSPGGEDAWGAGSQRSLTRNARMDERSPNAPDHDRGQFRSIYSRNCPRS